VAQDLSDEFKRERLLRLIKHLTRITGLDHIAAVYENDCGRDRYVNQGQVQVRMTKTAATCTPQPTTPDAKCGEKVSAPVSERLRECE
jgi:hypothetical protein